MLIVTDIVIIIFNLSFCSCLQNIYIYILYGIELYANTSTSLLNKLIKWNNKLTGTYISEQTYDLTCFWSLQ